ncbi:hypothetical protein M899_2714 [Bacteriovorax sp. BSW11_IV]|nr:hypothetical protein M899_2714 [Bacteriovorax sp. BSW11_IV]
MNNMPTTKTGFFISDFGIMALLSHILEKKTLKGRGCLSDKKAKVFKEKI